MKSVTAKIIILSVGISVAIAVALTASFSLVFRNMVNEQVALLDATLREGYDRSIRWEVETAVSLLDRVDALRKEGILPAETAQEVAKRLLRDARYDKEGYFWADTMDGTNVVLLGRDAEG
jgi:methyl-accepting chemotaxis protein